MELLGVTVKQSVRVVTDTRYLAKKYEVTVLIFTLPGRQQFERAVVTHTNTHIHIRTEGFRVWFLMSAYRRAIIC